MSTIAGRYEKKLADGCAFEFDFRPWLTSRKDTLATYDLLPVTPSGLDITGDSENSGIVKFYAEGGVVNVTYTIHCDILTVGSGVPRKKRSTIIIKVIA